jgi:hypothetical protein
MRISSIVPGHHDATRRVGIHFQRRTDAMQAAVHLYRVHGIDAELQETSLWVDAPRHLAPHVMALLERATGTPGFNDWDEHDYGTVTR